MLLGIGPCIGRSLSEFVVWLKQRIASMPDIPKPDGSLGASLLKQFYVFLAGFLAGLLVGYTSHLMLDSLTPASLPLLGLQWS
jgi:hypothetical protein